MGAESSKVSPTTSADECTRPNNPKSRKDLLFEAIQISNFDCVRGLLEESGGEQELLTIKKMV